MLGVLVIKKINFGDERFNNFLTLKVWQLKYLSYLYSVIRDKDMKNEKIKVKLQNEIYELPVKALQRWGGKEVIYVSHAEASSLVRQFAKKFFPQYVVKVSSQSFSGGNSLDVYVSTATGAPIPMGDYEMIQNFANQWEYGKFNGMYDIYEDYEESGAQTDNGFELKAGVKYVHVNNRPRFGTVESILNSVLNEGVPFEIATKYYTDSVGRVAKSKAGLMLTKMVG